MPPETNSIAQRYRSFLQAKGKATDRSDLELTFEVGNAMKTAGTFDQHAKSDPEFRRQYLDVAQYTDRGLVGGEIAAGGRRATNSLKGIATGALAFGLDVVGADETAAGMRTKAREYGRNETAAENAPTVATMDDVYNVESAVRYGAGKIGEAIPSLAEALLAGAIGSVAGSATAPGAGTVAGGIAGLVGRSAMKQMIKKGLATELGKDVTAQALEQALKSGASATLKTAFEREAKAIGARMGGAAAGFVNSYALSTGEIYNETGDAGIAASFGAVAAIPDTILPSYIAGKFFKGAVSKAEAEAAGGFWKRLSKEAVKTVPLETGTEAFQELVGIAAEKYKNGEPATLDEKDFVRLREAAVGGVAGGVLGAPLAAGPGGLGEATAKPAAKPDAIMEARRRVATGEAPPAAEVPREATRGEVLRSLGRLPSDQQDARVDALNRITRTKAEEQELQLLQAIISERPPTVADTTGAPLVVPVPPVPVVPVVPPVEAPAPTKLPTAGQLAGRLKQASDKLYRIAKAVPALDRTAAEGLLNVIGKGDITPERIAEFEVAIVALQLAGRVKQASDKLYRIAKEVPALDRTAAEGLFDVIGKGDVTPERIAEFEVAIVALQTASITQTAKDAAAAIANNNANLTKKQQDAEAAAKLKADKRAEAAAKKIQVAADKAAKKLGKKLDNAAPASTGVVDPLSAALTELAAAGRGAILPVADNAAPEATGAATTATGATTGVVDPVTPVVAVAPALLGMGKAVAQKDPINLLSFTRVLSDVSASGKKKKITSANLTKAIMGLIQPLDGKRLGFFSSDGNRSTTRISVALLTPSGKVINAGLLPKKLRLSVSGKMKSGYAIQGMGTNARPAGRPTKGSKQPPQTKSIVEGGDMPVLLEDLIEAGYVPFDSVLSSAEPGFIFTRFNNRADWEASVDATSTVQKSVVTRDRANSVEDAEAAKASQSETDESQSPAEIIDEVFADPELAKLKVALVQWLAGGPKLTSAEMTKVMEIFKENGVDLKQYIEEEGAEGAVLELLADVAVAQPTKPKKPAAEKEETRRRNNKPAADKPAAENKKKPAAEKKTLAYFVDEWPKFFSKIHGLLSSSAGRFDSEFLNNLSETDAIKIETISEKVAPKDRSRFDQRVQAAYDASSSDPEVFKRELRKFREGDEQVSIPARGQFNNLVARLDGNGFDVDVIARELLPEIIDPETGEARKNVRGWHQGSRVVVVMEDVLNANLANVVTLIHEVGHDEVAKLDIGTREQLSRAVDRTIAEVKDGKLITAATKANINWEEKLVETLAIKLAEEGFGAQAPTLADVIWRTVAETYYAVADAALKAFGITPSDTMVIDWFENSMRRRLGGDADARFTDLFRAHFETSAQRVRRYTVIDGQNIPDLVGRDGVMRFAEVLPDSLGAAQWNLARFQEGGGRNVDGLDGESIGMIYAESMARVQSAGWNETLPVIAKLKTDLGLTALTDKQFWKIFARGEPPKAILDEMEARFTGASTAKIDGDRMTEAMNQRATYQAFAGALSMANHARKRAANQLELADRDAVAMVALSERYNRIDPNLRDAEQMGAHLNDLLRDTIKEAARDLDRGPDAAFAAGNLIGAIRELERLMPDQLIPAEYKRVFKEVLDRSGTPLFNELSALAKLDLPLGKMSVTEVVQAIRDNAAADPALASLTKNRPLMLALASLAQNNTREMDMMQLRLVRDTATYIAIKAQLDEIRTASDTRLDEISKTLKSSQQAQTLSDRLRYEFLDVRRKFRAKQRAIARAEESAAINTRVASAMQQKANDLSRQVGAFSNWEPINGAVYMAMRLSDDGTWKAIDRKLQMIGPVAEQEAQIKSDLVANRNWLDIHSDQAGSPLYQEISKQTNELTHLDVGRQLEAVHRGFMDNMLMPLGKKFGSTGKPAGKRIQQMLNRYNAIAKFNADGVEAKARPWTTALQNAAKAAGFSNYRDFFQTVYDGVIYAVESEPGLGEAAVLRVAARAARRRIPEGFPVAADFDNKLAVLLRATKEINELLLDIAEKNGVFIEDSRINDPLTGKGTLLRHAIKYGFVTNSRKLRAGIIQTLVIDMEAAGWKARVKGSPGVAARDSMFAKIEPGEVPALIEEYFTPDIIREFVEPFVYKPGKEVFFGAPDLKGKARFVSQLEVQNLWQESGGDVLAFIDAMFDFSNVDNLDTLPEYRKAMLQRFDFLFNMESKLAAETGVVNSPSDPDGPKAHRIMDSRTNDLLPPEHFEYDVYDPANSRKMLEEIAYHAAFGRNGDGLKGAGADLRNDLQSDARAYGLLNGSRKQKMKKAASKGQDFRRLELAADTLARVDPWLEQIGKYFNTKNQAGAVGDARALLSLVGLNVAAFLNSVKSGLNNVVSLGDFPVVFGGISKTSLNAVRLATGNLMKGVFGTALESIGINVIRASEYAKEIGEFNESRKTALLPFSEFMADIGMGGRFQSGKTDRVIQGTRYLQQLFRKGMKFGSGKDFGPFHLLWAPFRFFNEQSASAIATANVQTFEMIVKRAMDYYAANPEDAANPAHRFTAADLKMDGTWFSDESAFKFFRDRAVDQKIGNIEDIARDAAKRVAGGDRLLTRDQVIGIAMVALDEISMESSVNSRASELSTNTWLKYGGVLLGWPLSKMNQVNQSLKTPEGQLTAKSFLKGIGIMAAWSLPVSLAYSLMIDDYDEEFLGKKSNLRGVGADKTAVDNSLAVVQRVAKTGAYGLGGDFASSFINWVDPKSGQRDFDLNSRIVIYSQFANFRNMVRNFVLQDFTYTYESVGRGLVYAMGGGGLLQYQQMLNKHLGLNNSESATTNRINVANYIRAAAPEVGLELKAGGARSSPTPMSVWLREMQVTALANDRMGFLNAYRNAIEVSRKGGDMDAENTVRQGFQSRTPLSVLGRQPSEAEFAKLIQAMDETGRDTLRTAMRLHETFAAMITPDPTERKFQLAERREMGMTRPDSFMAARRKAAVAGMGY